MQNETLEEHEKDCAFCQSTNPKKFDTKTARRLKEINEEQKMMFLNLTL